MKFDCLVLSNAGSVDSVNDRMISDGTAIYGMKVSKGKRSTWRKLFSVSLSTTDPTSYDLALHPS
jgi:hypothetical protein